MAEETALKARKRADEAEKLRLELLRAQEAAEKAAATVRAGLQLCMPGFRVSALPRASKMLPTWLRLAFQQPLGGVRQLCMQRDAEFICSYAPLTDDAEDTEQDLEMADAGMA